MTSLKKDPDDVADFWFDWGSDLITDPEDRFLSAGEVIASAAVEVPMPLTNVEEDFTSKVVRVRISGGVLGGKYDLECSITTNDGQTFYGTKQLEVKERIVS